MKIRHIILLALIFGAVTAWVLQEQRGFILIAWSNKTLEMRLWVGLISLLILMLLVSVISWMFFHLFGTTKRFKRWSLNRGSKRSRSQTISGLVALTESNWVRAEELFNKAINNADSPLINYLLAAKAAQEQGHFNERDDYLKKASEFEPEASNAVAVTQADLQFDAGQFEQALATLTQLYKNNKHQNFVVKLLAKTYVELKDWPHLFELLPELKKKQILSKEKYVALEENCLTNLLLKSAESGREHLIKIWERLSKEQKSNAKLQILLIRQLVKLNVLDHSEDLARSFLKKQYHPELIYWYAKTQHANPANQLQFASSFKNQGLADWQLFYALGLLSFREQHWGQTRDYLQQSIALKPTGDAYQLLIKTMHFLNESVSNLNSTLNDALKTIASEH